MLLASPEDHCAGPWGSFNARSVLASLCSTSAQKIHWGSPRRAAPGNSAPGSLANSLYHPVLLAEGAAVVLFHPQGHAAVMEGMIAFSPDHNTILLFVFSLTSKTGIHDLDPADGARVALHVPAPHGHRVPLLEREHLVAARLGARAARVRRQQRARLLAVLRVGHGDGLDVTGGDGGDGGSAAPPAGRAGPPRAEPGGRARMAGAVDGVTSG